MPNVNQDNKTYNFQPGKSGSLTSTYNAPKLPVIGASKVSKVVPALKEMRKRRQNAVQVAALRG